MGVIIAYISLFHYVISTLVISIQSADSIEEQSLVQRPGVQFASLLSGGFITAIVVNLPERKLEKRTSVQRLSTYDIGWTFLLNMAIFSSKLFCTYAGILWDVNSQYL